MLDYQKLKELNKQTDNLQKPYELQVMAIPRELWDAMVQYQTEIGKYLLQANDQIVKLPTWENITEEKKKKYVPKSDKKKRKKTKHQSQDDYDLSL